MMSFLKKKKKDFITEKIEQHVQIADTNTNSSSGQTKANDSTESINMNAGDKVNETHQPSQTSQTRQIESETGKKLKYATKLLKQSSGILLEKEILIKKLSSKIESGTTQSDSTLFNKYSDVFETEELKKLRSMKPGIKSDSTFILNLMRGLYKGSDISKLKSRTATGRNYKNQQKHEISFEKKNIIKEMFTERLEHETCDDVTKISMRLGKVNDLIRSAIHNITRHIDKTKKRNRDTDDNFEIPEPKKTKSNEVVEPSQVKVIFTQFIYGAIIDN